MLRFPLALAVTALLAESAPPARADEPILMVAPGAEVQVRFVPRDPENKYLVSAANIKVEQSNPGTKPPECVAPCVLPVNAGAVTVRVTGSGYFAKSVMIPDRPVTLEIQHERKALVYTGMGFTYGGGLFLLNGLAFLSLVAVTSDSGRKETFGAVGGVTLGVGGALLGVGLYLWLHNRGDHLVMRDSAVAQRRQRPALAGLGFGPDGQGGASASATISF